MPEETAAERVQRIVREREAAKAPPPVHPEEVLVTENDVDTKYQDNPLHEALKNYPILELYRTLVPDKKIFNSSGKAEIKVRCPEPAHTDEDPTACLNTDTNLWVCYEEWCGGDNFTLAARVYRMNEKTQFKELMERMALDLGIEKVKDITGKLHVVPPVPETTSFDAEVVEFPHPDLDKDDVGGDIEIPPVPWKEIFPPNTYLDEAMQTLAEPCDIPHEFWVFPLMQTVAAMAGNQVTIQEFPPVKANLYVLLYAKSGTKKSTVTDPIIEILRAMPHDRGEPGTRAPEGCLVMSQPKTGPALVDLFVFPIMDSTTKKIEKFVPVNGYVELPEFADFASDSSRDNIKIDAIKLYDRAWVSGHTKGTKTETAERPFCQLLATTQPETVHSYLKRGDARSGFLNRFVLCTGQRRSEKRWIIKALPSLDHLIFTLHGIHGWCATGKQYEWEPVLEEYWTQKCNEHLKADEDDPLRVRLDLMLKKFLLILLVNSKADHIREDMIDRAFLFLPYLEATMRVLGEDVRVSELDLLQTKILHFTKEYESTSDDGPGIREMSRSLVRTGSREEIVKALEILVKSGMMRPYIFKGQRGPARDLYTAKDSADLDSNGFPNTSKSLARTKRVSK